MPNDTDLTVQNPMQSRPVGRDFASRRSTFLAQLDQQGQQLSYVLPAHVPVERFRAVCVTAVHNNPDLLYADRQSLFVSALKCATDGLLPDGRQAALVVFPNTKIKRRNREGLSVEVHIDAVQYLPMIHGIRQRMRNTGEILSATAEVVYANDEYHRELGDDPKIVHKPPPLAKDRGEMVGAYAIIKLKNGEVIRETMSKAQIEKVRPRNWTYSMMWKDYPDEAWRKTVMRRASKQAPQSAELDAMLQRGDLEAEPEDRLLEQPWIEGESQDVSEPAHDPVPTAEPSRHPPRSVPPPEPKDETFEIITLDGEPELFFTSDGAASALIALIGDAAKMGAARLDGFVESNEALIDYLGSAHGHGDVIQAIAEARAEADSEQKEPEAAHAPTPAQRAPAALPARSEWYDRKSLEIPIAKKNSRADWATWAKLFSHRIEGAVTTPDLARLCGDNEAALAEFRAAVPRDAAALDARIRAQYDRIGPDA